MAYATAAELRAHVGKTLTDADPVLTTILSAATQAIDGYCNRPQGFLAGTTAEARVFVGEGGPICWVDECVEITQVGVKTSPNDSTYQAWAGSDWLAGQGDPVARPIYNRTPYTFISISPAGSKTAFTSGYVGSYSAPTVQVTAKWGFATMGGGVADLLREACIAQATRWYQRAKSGWADAQASPEFGMLLFRKALDPDIQMMLVNANLRKAVI